MPPLARIVRLVFATVFVVASHAACSDDASDRSLDTAVQPDAADIGKDATTHDATTHDTRAVDATPDAPDTEPPPCSYVEVELSDQSGFVAQYIASYDHRLWWWDVADQTTLAFFREADFDAYPNDRSFRFVALADVIKMREVSPGDQRCYRDFVRDAAMTVERPPLEGTSQILMGNAGYHRYEGGTGDFAWDFTRVDDTGARYEGDGHANADYLVFDEPVYSPVSGYVIEVVRDGADNTPGDYPEDAVNNLVGIHLGGSFYLYLLHFKQGSIPDEVAPDTTIEAGDLLGRVGNSGVSLEPHLHVTLLWYDDSTGEPRSWSVPTEFANIEVGPTPRGPFEAREFAVPRTGESVR